MFRKGGIAVLLLVINGSVLHAESVPRPSKEGLLWADSGIEGLVEYYECVQAHSLYNLDWIACTPEYRYAQSESERADVVYQKFLARKLQVQRNNVLRIGGWTKAVLLWGTCITAGPWAAVKCGTYIRKPENSGGNIELEKVAWESSKLLLFAWLTTGGDGMQVFSLPMLVKRWIGSWFYASLEAPMEDQYLKTEEAYARHYFSIKAANPQLLAELKRSMVELREGFGRAAYFYNELVTTATKLPLQKGEFVFDGQQFGECYQFYPKQIKKTLTNILGRICFFGATDTELTTNFPLYFQGIPGSGKTYAVNNITEVTGAPVSHITLDGGTIEEIIGTKYGRPGRLLTALINGSKGEGANFSNGVLFIDEFDRLLSDSQHDPSAKALLSFMLKMLDPSNRRFFSPYLNCYVDLPSTIILAGNYEIKDPALANRFQIVKFNGYDEERKWGIAKNYLAPKVAKIYGFDKVEEEDLEAINEIVWDDMEDDGVRSVELKIIQYFEEKRMAQFLGEPASE